MLDLIQDIFLSPLLGAFLIGIMLLAVTRWAWAMEEMPGYIFGWLLGFFFIVIYSAVTGDTPEETTTEAVKLSLFSALIPALCGIVFGAGLLLLMRIVGNSHIQRSITIAIFTGLFIVMIFLTIVTSQRTSEMVSIFALALAIGAVGTIIFTGVPSMQRPTNAGGGFRASAADVEEKSPFGNVRRGDRRRD